MSPDEAALLQKIGKNLRQTFAAIVVETFVFPLYGVCVYKACSILRKKPRAWMVGINMTIIILLFLMAFSLLAIDISNFVTELDVTFIHHPEVALATRYAASSNATFRRVVVINAMYAYMTVLGDAIIVWRVYALWGSTGRRWVLLLPYAVLLGSAITTFLLTYCVAVLGTELFEGAFINPPFCRKIQVTSYAMPTVTTFVATTLIGITTWNYRRTMKIAGSPTLARSKRVQRVLLLLVESGFIYFLFFLYTVLNNAPVITRAIFAREDLTFADLVITFSTSIIVGCYPTLIIILAHSDRTVLETTFSTQATFHAARRPTTSDFSSSLVGGSRGTGTKVAEEIELHGESALNGDLNEHKGISLT